MLQFNENTPEYKLEHEIRMAVPQMLSLLFGNTRQKEEDRYNDILEQYNLHELSTMNVVELNNVGFSTKEAIKLRTAALIFANMQYDRNNRTKITSSADAYNFIYPFLQTIDHEQFYILAVNRANIIIGTHLLSKGGITGTVADIKLLFNYLICKKAIGFIVAHNHPSGNITPSENDKRLTQQIKEASKLLEMTLMDSIIVGDDKYFSFADEGLL